MNKVEFEAELSRLEALAEKYESGKETVALAH